MSVSAKQAPVNPECERLARVYLDCRAAHGMRSPEATEARDELEILMCRRGVPRFFAHDGHHFSLDAADELEVRSLAPRRLPIGGGGPRVYRTPDLMADRTLRAG